ncbi:cutinase [Mycobacterium saskatchewanense]|uniref:cutinase family protein n=1 Tax=Mycobacterium saskatchewanense TaxID=220927 RepID=UPI00138DC695|nr:cutinase [Mycobacterium saskatchewanense]
MQPTSTVARLLAVIVVAFGLVSASTAVSSAAGDDKCPDVELIFARGTFEPPGLGATGQAFADALTARLPGTSISSYGVNYPASLDFSQASDGVVDASARVGEIVGACPNTKIVLGGYSQGAAVAAYITADSVPPGYALPAGITGPMPPTVAKHVAAVVLFGKPSDGFLNLVDHDAPPISIGNLYAGKTIDLCAPDDPVCSGAGFNRAAHSAYRFNGMTDQAADFAAKAIESTR